MNRDVEDVLVGIARLDWYSSTARKVPLSVKKLVYLFQELEVFTVKDVGESLELATSQSKIYFRACNLIIKHLDHFEELSYDLVERELNDFDKWFDESQ